MTDAELKNVKVEAYSLAINLASLKEGPPSQPEVLADAKDILNWLMEKNETPNKEN